MLGGFTLAALSIPLTNATSSFFISPGRGQDILIAESINCCALVFSFVGGLPYGPVGVAIAFSCFKSCSSPSSLVFSRGTARPCEDSRSVCRVLSAYACFDC